MALQLRRGSDAERIAITFAEGELVYTTDTKKIWIGDGTTPGGVNVTAEVELSPSQLDKNLDLNNFEINGTGSIDITGNISNVGDLSVTGNIIDVVDITATGDISTTGTISGNFIGDASQLTNLPIEGSEFKVDIKATDDTIIVDHTTKTFNGTFIGDGSGLTNLPIQPGGFINGATYNLTVSANDSTILVNSSTKEFRTENLSIIGSKIINRLEEPVEIYSPDFEVESTLTLHIPSGGSFRLNSYNGVYSSKESTNPGENLNNIRFAAYKNGSDKLLGGIITQWDSNADFDAEIPAARIAIYAGDNTQNPKFAVFNGLSGSFESPIMKTGTYADATDRDTKIANPEAGMIIFVQDAGSGSPAFQGYNGTTWTNLS